MVALVLFAAFIIFMLMRVPIGISIGLACLVAIFTSGTISPLFLAQNLITSTDSFPLMAVPFFILAGEIMAQGGISRRLFNFARIFVGNITGGLGIAVVLTSMFFAAISGSGPATVAAIGGMAIPMLVAEGYDKKFVTALVACAGTLGVIIPPSIPMVIYGVSSGASIGDLFLAGIVPGIVMGLALAVYAYFYAKVKGYERDQTKFTGKLLFSRVREAFWSLLIPVIILGGIYGGIFTPTEAAVVAVVYGLIVATCIYRELPLSKIYSVFIKSALTTGVILIITGTATTFGRILALERIPEMIANGITGISENPIILLLIINLFLLFIGMFMDTLAAIIILTPILFPIAVEIGVDPIHFGIILVVNLAIGFITPPLGGILFVATGISGLSISKISKAVIPMFLILVAVLLVITFVPEILVFG
ncbi:MULTISPECIES: TRAP transporter large permease [Oceanobacillus]|uniref:TRAP transporter large permease n=1 Tax=Oceanobacillus TaxID=182709 RepID=UPI0003499067|nr:TRAP transporter large permease [Oceanobacillus kimchii]